MESIRLYDRALARLSRRELLNVAWALGITAIAQPITARFAWAKPVFSSYPFTLGVASGDPLPGGVVLWTRLAPDPLNGGGMPMAAVEVGWEVAADSGFGTIVQTGTALARPELGHSVHVELNGLEAGREYWYRFRAGDEISQTGRTRTAPAMGAAVEEIRFGVCGCNHYETGYFTAFRRIAEENFDFVFHTGDYIYEGRDDGGRNDRLREHQGQEIYTIVDYRNRYAQYKSDADFKAAHASSPFIVSWDDHEVENNYAGDIDENDTPPAVFALRRAAAYQAWYESMPVRVSQMPVGAHLNMYRRMIFGDLLDFNVLDTRQYRSNQACGDGSRTDCAEALDPARTMLGNEQERWLFDNLATARSRWTILGQQVPIFTRDFSASAPNGQFSMDKWDGYVAARNRLSNRLIETGAPNPVAFSGDVHLAYGADLKMDYADPDSRTIGVEFTNTSVTSNGDGTDVAGNWEQIKGDNPHIKYHSARRGYIAVTATQATLQADFKILDKVTVPGLPTTLGGSLTAEAGAPGAQAT
ncbi:MAG: alkaline phosphatase D family protein [Bauldia sp.]|nr:alkaline phosphatase D family protein [Bauldia sp.]